MKQVSRSALVSFSAEQMFFLVNDVARYPEFCPVVPALVCWSRVRHIWWHRWMFQKRGSVRRLPPRIN